MATLTCSQLHRDSKYDVFKVYSLIKDFWKLLGGK